MCGPLPACLPQQSGVHTHSPSVLAHRRHVEAGRPAAALRSQSQRTAKQQPGVSICLTAVPWDRDHLDLADRTIGQPRPHPPPAGGLDTVHGCRVNLHLSIDARARTSHPGPSCPSCPSCPCAFVSTAASFFCPLSWRSRNAACAVATIRMPGPWRTPMTAQCCGLHACLGSPLRLQHGARHAASQLPGVSSRPIRCSPRCGSDAAGGEAETAWRAT